MVLQSNKFRMIGFTFIVLNALYGYRLHVLVIGSDTAASRQTFVRFPASGNNNSVLGFAGLNGGFSLADNKTSFTFNSYLPVGSSALLNQGTCYLGMDLVFDGLFELASTGTIRGNRRVIKFMERNTPLQLPRYGRMTNYIARTSANASINTVDFSSDDALLAVGPIAQTGKHDLYVYRFDGSNVSLAASYDNGSSAVNQVSWQPLDVSPSYFVVGCANGLRAFSFVSSTSALTLTDSLITSVNVNAVAWNSAGTELVVGKGDTAEEVAVYNFSAGSLTHVSGANLYPNRTVQKGAIDWNPVSNFIVVGTNAQASVADLYLFYFDGNLTYKFPNFIELTIGSQHIVAGKNTQRIHDFYCSFVLIF